MIVTTVTSRYLPNLRYIARLCEVDRAVVLDMAPLPHRNRDSFVTRNRIPRGATGEEHWLTVPVRRRGLAPQLRDARIDETHRRFARKHILTLRNEYALASTVAPGFIDRLGDAISSNTESLLNLNTDTLRVIMDTLGVSHREPILESGLVASHTKAHRVEIAVALTATHYVAGDVEWRSLNESGAKHDFDAAGINITRARSIPADLHREAIHYSVVHLICGQGIECARDTLTRMLT